MSKEAAAIPEALKPMHCHGVELQRGQGSSGNWVGDCPFCGKERHLFAHPERGTWDCKVCGAEGNQVTFLTKLMELAREDTTRKAFAELSSQRGIPAGVLRDAGLARRDGEWLIPCTSDTGTVRDIRRWRGAGTMSTAGCKSQLWGMDALAANPQADVWLCEGEWDGMAMRWVLRDAGVPETDAVVVAVPGATVLKPEWTDALAGRRVTTVYDHDDAGDRGQIKSHAALSGKASELAHVCWPEDSPDGYDLRDFAREAVPARGAVTALAELVGLARLTPRRETGDGSDEHPGESASGKQDESRLPDDVEFPDVVAQFKRYLDVNQEFEDALKVCLAVCYSNDVKDDPVWMYLMGTAGVGKTQLLSSLQGSRRCVFRSTITPKCLVSGWRGEGSKDPSLIPKLKGKTLVVKDFTEVLSMPEPAQKEVYSTLRGAFDGYVDKTFGNGMSRHYSDCHFTLIAGSTPAILKHRESAMGERFLRLRLNSLGEEARRGRMAKALATLGGKARRDDETQKVVAAFLKGKMPGPQELPRIGREASDRLMDAAELVAAMRTQVERDVRQNDPHYRPEAEAPDRVLKQLGSLAVTLAWIDGDDEVGGDNMRLVERIALDTVCGFDYDVVAAVMRMGGSATKKDVAESARMPSSTVARRIDDLLMTGVLEVSGEPRGSGPAGGRPSVVYRVSDRLAALWRRVKGEQQWSSKDSAVKGASTRPSRPVAARRLVRRRSATASAR